MRYMFLRFPEGKAKAVTLSYDDGCIHDMRFSDTITKYGLKCTFNLCGSSVGKSEWSMTAQQAKEYILDRGHEIAVHGDNHKAPGKQKSVFGIKDVLDCRVNLENMFDMIIRGMAYPDTGITSYQNGANYESIRHYLKDLDILYSRSLAGDNDKFELPTDWYNWIPTAHHINPELMNYIDKFNLDYEETHKYIAGRTPNLFYLWGHSFEFESNHNWELLEEICRRLSGKEDVWYATNMEIYEYVTAYNSLVFSADGKRVYNPTLLDIWFETDNVPKMIKSGETILL